jgi:beta-glucosidase
MLGAGLAIATAQEAAPVANVVYTPPPYKEEYGPPPPIVSTDYRDPALSPEARAESLLRNLTLEEKIRLLSGDSYMGTPGIKRLGIPPFVMTDGPLGARSHGQSTAYASGMILAASWNVDLAQQVGASLGRDCRARGVHILLAPGMNLYRAPMCGRNFEYLGEDPLLAGGLASAYIRGVQGEGVAAVAKHFINNEQEFDRHRLSSDVDERTLRELYMRPFKICVDAGVVSVMTSYNPLNGVHTSENEWLISTVLKKEWGFQGFVVSDWESTYNSLNMSIGGLDLEMPSGRFFNKSALVPLLQSGKITEDGLNDKIRRRLRVGFTMGWFDREQLRPEIPKDDPESARVALEGAREGVILLKNERDLLPLDLAKVRKIVVLGPNADPAVTGAAGSSFTKPFRSVSVLQGLRNIGGPGVEVIHVPWAPAGTAPAVQPGVKLAATEALRLPVIPVGTEALLKSADAVVVCVGFQDPTTGTSNPANPASEGEGNDRRYELAPGQRELILEAERANPNTIVILNGGGSVRTIDWISEAPVLLHAFYPGQEGGTALAEILFGKVNPSGKLPFSWEKRWEDCAAYGNYPSAENPKANAYKEGIFLGYRWFDSKGIAPLFPFGYGLSYTKFAYRDLTVTPAPDRAQLRFTIENIGSRAGAEIAQVYVESPKGDAPRPAQELAGFTKVYLQPGESRTVTMEVPTENLRYWNPETKTWTLTQGQYIFRLGAHSRQLSQEARVQL